MDKSTRRASWDDRDDDTRGRSMGFLEHLDELRTRLIRACLAVAAGMCVAFFFVDRLGDFVLAPTMRALPPGESLILTKLGEGFAFYLDVALIGGFALYLISIGIAWIVGPKAGSEKELGGSDQLRLVVGAVVADQARRAGFGPRRTPRSRRALI